MTWITHGKAWPEETPMARLLRLCCSHLAVAAYEIKTHILENPS